MHFVAASIDDFLAQRIEQHGHRLWKIDTGADPGEGDANWDRTSWPNAVQALDAERTEKVVRQVRASHLVMDHYRLDRAYAHAIRSMGTRVLVIDDLANRRHDCDWLVDHSLNRTVAEYRTLVPTACAVHTGTLYCLLRPEFQTRRRQALVKRNAGGPLRRILISLGTTDVAGMSERALKAILDSEFSGRVDVVLPFETATRRRVEGLAQQHENVVLHDQVSDMASLMASADLAVGAGGTTSWERCCLGLPTVTLILAENQRYVAQELGSSGAAIIVESPLAITVAVDCMMRDDRQRAMMEAAAFSACDGLGAGRVADVMLEVERAGGTGTPELREARPEDSELVWLWRNDPSTRRNSQQSTPIPWSDHSRWYAATLANEHRRVLIGHFEGQPIGMIRFDAGKDRRVEVSVNIAPAARGGGTGKSLLRYACDDFESKHPGAVLTARIHETNRVSQAVFEKAGFRRTGALETDGFCSYERRTTQHQK